MKQVSVAVNRNDSLTRRIKYIAIFFSLFFNCATLFLILILMHRQAEFKITWPENIPEQYQQKPQNNSYQFDPISCGQYAGNPYASFVTEPPLAENITNDEPQQEDPPQPVPLPENSSNISEVEETSAKNEAEKIKTMPEIPAINEPKMHVNSRPQLRSSAHTRTAYETFTKPIAQQKAPETETQNKPTLSDITKSYIQHVRREEFKAEQKQSAQAIYAPHADGKNLAFQVYSSKVANCIQQAAHLQKNLIYAEKNFNAQSIVSLNLDKDGKLLHVNFSPPFEEKDISNAIESIMKRVGLFPPLPKSLEVDSIVLTFPINVRGEKGFGHYSLSFGQRA